MEAGARGGEVEDGSIGTKMHHEDSLAEFTCPKQSGNKATAASAALMMIVGIRPGRLRLLLHVDSGSCQGNISCARGGCARVRPRRCMGPPAATWCRRGRASCGVHASLLSMIHR